MAADFCRSGQISPTNFTRPLEKVFDDAQHTGHINLMGRKLKEFPKLADKYDLTDTSAADLSRNRLNEIPPAICDYRSMERLVAYHNVIRCLPDSILQLQCLSYLNLSCNQLSHIPPFICRVQSLEVLIVSNNKLVSVPEELGRLDKLTELDVSCNEINVLPSQLGDLDCLRVLNVRKNLLVELPIELSRLKLRKLDISCNKIGVIPPEYRLLETLDTLLVDHNPLTSPPAHICTKGRVHIMKYLLIEAIKEDKKRGLMGDNDMRRYFRKSASQQKHFEELSALGVSHLQRDPGVDAENQRDSGYITTDEKPLWANKNGVSKLADDSMPPPPPYPGRGVPDQSAPVQNGVTMPSPRAVYKPKFTLPSPQANHVTELVQKLQQQNHVRVDRENEFPPPPEPEVDEFTRELQRQKSEYEARKKRAELLRRQRDGEQKVQQDEIVSKVIEERTQDVWVGSRAQDERLLDGRSQNGTARINDDTSFVDQQREEARRRLEEKTRNRPQFGKLLLDGRSAATVVPRNHDDVDADLSRFPPPPPEFFDDEHSLQEQASPARESNKKSPVKYRKSGHRSKSPSHYSSLPRSRPGSAQHADSLRGRQAQTPPPKHSRANSDCTPSSHARSASDVAVPMYSSPRSKGSVTPVPCAPDSPTRPAHDPQPLLVAPPSPRRVLTRQTSGDGRPDSVQVVSPTGRHAQLQRQVSEPAPVWMNENSSQQPGRPVNHSQDDGEFRNRHEAMMRHQQQEASTLMRKIEDEKDRLLRMKKEPLYNYLTKKTSLSDDDLVNDRQTDTNQCLNNSSLPAPPDQAHQQQHEAFNVRLPEELRYINPNFTVRRHFEQAREEMEQIERLRREIESRLKVQLPADVPSALKDGIVLCHLANYVRPRSVSSIHVPPPSATSLSIGKCRRNVENFLEACRKIGVDERHICSAADILEERDIVPLASTVHALLSLSNPHASAV